MHKPTFLCAALALAAFAPTRQLPPSMHLDGERILIEYTVGSNEAVVIVSAESDQPLNRVAVLDPLGQVVLELSARSSQGLALSGFKLETEEATAGALLLAYPEGEYQLRGRSVDGVPARGRAALSHSLPLPPRITYPLAGETGVPTTGLTLTWTPDPAVTAYRIVLEQDDNDGLEVTLPAGTGSFAVPPGFLAGAAETLFEVGAVGANGNSTISEVVFTTL